MIGKIIKVTGDSAGIIEIGSYGVITEKAYGDKWCVEFIAKVNGKGSLIHTVREKDFKIVGEIYQ